MNKNADLLGANFVGTVTKYKQHGVDDIGFTTAIGANDGRETLRNYQRKTILFLQCSNHEKTNHIN